MRGGVTLIYSLDAKLLIDNYLDEIQKYNVTLNDELLYYVKAVRFYSKIFLISQFIDSLHMKFFNVANSFYRAIKYSDAKYALYHKFKNNLMIHNAFETIITEDKLILKYSKNELPSNQHVYKFNIDPIKYQRWLSENKNLLFLGLHLKANLVNNFLISYDKNKVSYVDFLKNINELLLYDHNVTDVFLNHDIIYQGNVKLFQAAFHKITREVFKYRTNFKFHWVSDTCWFSV